MRNIAIVCGGHSGEFEISMASGKMAFKHIDRKKYRPFLIVIENRQWNWLTGNGEKVKRILPWKKMVKPSGLMPFSMPSTAHPAKMANFRVILI